jgi:uncharacterized membrane protein YdfJ with MMPL/SSD domain
LVDVTGHHVGIGVGIDYALLMVTRFREWRAAGLNPEDATVATLKTAGRSVMLAGITVVISMLGLFGMGLSFMRGAALVTIAAILIVLLSAVTLFPALLGYFGTHIDRLRLPIPRRKSLHANSTGSGWLQWSRSCNATGSGPLSWAPGYCWASQPHSWVFSSDSPTPAAVRKGAQLVPPTTCSPTVSGQE